MTKEELKNNTPKARKIYLRERVDRKIPIGLLGYEKDIAVAWCSIAPRETYQRLGGDESKPEVWSLVCFYIKKEFRDKGLLDQLIEEAKKYARRNGARYLEAYPVKPDSPSYRFMGFISSFEKAGFEFVKTAGTRRHVMIYKL